MRNKNNINHRYKVPCIFAIYLILRHPSIYFFILSRDSILNVYNDEKAHVSHVLSVNRRLRPSVRLGRRFASKNTALRHKPQRLRQRRVRRRWWRDRSVGGAPRVRPERDSSPLVFGVPASGVGCPRWFCAAAASFRSPVGSLGGESNRLVGLGPSPLSTPRACVSSRTFWE